MANAFYWECSVFPMAIAPWHHDWTQQQVVNARVTVAEQRTPSFALRFDLELPRTEALTCKKHLMRLVNQQQMRRAFEFAFVGEKAVGRRPPGGDGNSKLLDQRLKNWLTGCEQAQGLPKEELSKWLLSWMMLTERKGDDGDGENPQEWLVLLCGEEGVEDVWEEETLSDVYHESSDTSESFMGGEKLSDEYMYCWDENSGDDEDLPPPYDKIKDAEVDLSIQDGHCDKVGKTQSTRSLIQGTSRSLVSSHSAEVIPKPKLQPTIVSLEIRHGALDREYPEEFTAEWATDQRHLPRDFCASRRAVQVAKRQYDQTIKVAQVRHTEMLRETAKKAVEMEQTRRDAQVLRQLNADTLEYRKELNRIEAQMKQTSIAARREQQRAKRKMRGIWHGTDTMEPFERFVTKEREHSSHRRRDGRAVHVYDLNGRRQEQDVERSSTLSSSSAGSERRKNDHRERENTTRKLGRQRIWMEVEAVKAAQERLYRFFQKDQNSL